MFRKFLRVLRVTPEKPLTLEEVKTKILRMKSGEKHSFSVDRMPEDQEFDNLTGWIAMNKGTVYIGRDYKKQRLDISIL